MFGLLLTLHASAFAQDPVDLGFLQANSVRVVQQMLYPKAGRVERGLHLGTVAFDPFATSFLGYATWAQHRSEQLALSAIAGAGYGFSTAQWRALGEPPYGVAPDAQRTLGVLLGGAEWTPIYAKASVLEKKVVHFDLYGAGRGGLTVEQSLIPSGGVTLAPTVSAGLGTRIFLGDDAVLRFELRDDALLQHRALTDTTHLKQNLALSVGYTKLKAAK